MFSSQPSGTKGTGATAKSGKGKLK
jgi:hypothetical protein